MFLIYAGHLAVYRYTLSHLLLSSSSQFGWSICFCNIIISVPVHGSSSSSLVSYCATLFSPFFYINANFANLATAASLAFSFANLPLCTCEDPPSSCIGTAAFEVPYPPFPIFVVLFPPLLSIPSVFLFLLISPLFTFLFLQFLSPSLAFLLFLLFLLSSSPLLLYFILELFCCFAAQLPQNSLIFF